MSSQSPPRQVNRGAPSMDSPSISQNFLTILVILLSFLLNEIHAKTSSLPAVSTHLSKSVCEQAHKYSQTGKLQEPRKQRPNVATPENDGPCGWYVRMRQGKFQYKKCEEIETDHDGTSTRNTTCSRQAPKEDQGPQKSYRGYKLWHLKATTSEQLKVLQDFENSGYDFWMGPAGIGRPSDVMVSPEQESEFKKKIKNVNLKQEVIIKDVQVVIDKNTRTSQIFDLFNYNEWFQIHKFFSDQQKQHPRIARVIEYGYSYECRPLKALRISKSNDKKPIIFIESGIHGREWISPAVAVYLTNELLNGHNRTIRGWLDDFDFYILAPVNVDGYAYSFSKERLWRKTRTPSSFSDCKGADPNRNWDFKWDHVGSSKNPCDQSYRGSAPMSEPSVRWLGKFLEGIGHRLALYYAVHSYAQVIIIPYAYSEEHFPFYRVEKAISDNACKAMGVRTNKTYFAGTLKENLRITVGGSSVDWVKDRFNQTLSYGLELPPSVADAGSGFVLPPENIQPVSLEFLDGLQVYIQFIRSQMKSKKN